MEALSQRQAGSGAEMTDRFLRTRGIKDEKVLKAMQKVPRHRFISESLRSHAYSDAALPIGFDQTISQPYIVALMTEELLRGGGQRFLEIGTGSGYQTAILAEVSKAVFSIERIFSFIPEAKRRLEQLGYHNVSIQAGNGAVGWPEFSPYDGIIVTAAVKSLPKAWVDQLVEGGVIVVPIETPDGRQTLYSIKKMKDKTIKKTMTPCRFVPFIDDAK